MPCLQNNIADVVTIPDAVGREHRPGISQLSWDSTKSRTRFVDGLLRGPYRKTPEQVKQVEPVQQVIDPGRDVGQYRLQWNIPHA